MTGKLDTFLSSVSKWISNTPTQHSRWTEQGHISALTEIKPNKQRHKSFLTKGGKYLSQRRGLEIIQITSFWKDRKDEKGGLTRNGVGETI